MSLQAVTLDERLAEAMRKKGFETRRNPCELTCRASYARYLARGRVLSPVVSLLSYALTARTLAGRYAGHH